MLTIICLTILAYWMLGKDSSALLKRIRKVDWHAKINDLTDSLRPHALKAGRTAARPMLQFYYVMDDDRTSTLDRALIYAALIYVVSPVNLLPSAVYKLLGILDEGVAVLYVYRKIRDRITPEINARVDATLDEWFGVEYEQVAGQPVHPSEA